MQTSLVSKSIPSVVGGHACFVSGVRPALPLRTSRRMLTRVAEVSAPTQTQSEAVGFNPLVEPATLPDTPLYFPIGPEELVNLAKAAFATQTGLDDESVLADDFRFEFPVVSLAKDDYLKAVRSFDLKLAIPDLNANAYDFRVDPYENNRVWFTIRTTGTHTGTLKFNKKEFTPTGKNIRGAPECCSYVFNKDGKVQTFTGGYVMDRRVGNTGGLGALFGILHAIGFPVPRPGTLGYAFALLMNRVLGFFRSLFGGKKE